MKILYFDSEDQFFNFMFIEFASIICSVERGKFEVVPQDGRFDVMCKGSILKSLDTYSVLP